MKLEDVISKILNPASGALPMSMDSPAARTWLLTIGLQESRFEHRYQVLNDPTKKGPARGFWQFEEGGGVKGVMNHSATSGFAQRICEQRRCPWDRKLIWARLEHDDILAACFARLLLYSDPFALPGPHEVEAGWKLYADRTWRPGKPHRETWDQNNEDARRALGIINA